MAGVRWTRPAIEDLQSIVRGLHHKHPQQAKVIEARLLGMARNYGHLFTGLRKEHPSMEELMVQKEHAITFRILPGKSPGDEREWIEILWIRRIMQWRPPTGKVNVWDFSRGDVGDYHGIPLFAPECAAMRDVETLLREPVPQVRILDETSFGFEARCGHVIKFHVERAELSRIPETFGSLSRLKDLDLSSNCLESIPEAIGSLTSL